MVIDLVSKKGWGGLGYALNFISLKLSSSRPWVFLEVLDHSGSRIFLPSLSYRFREAVSQKKIFWIQCVDSRAPEIAQRVLESSLCQGILLRGLERFSRISPAALWGRRWQLAAKKGSSDLLWVHETNYPVIGFDVRIEWSAPGIFEVKRGFGHLHPARESSEKVRSSDRIETNEVARAAQSYQNYSYVW